MIANTFKHRAAQIALVLKQKWVYSVNVEITTFDIQPQASYEIEIW